ncbi:hypothetical protein [Victivallis sp. Marseille-Q1083]|uniref:hypothetical protein n=1 Tax=Victivallis sp. Marseille-Q1083 TaxID=2717288 RepID=UPI0015894390|nr:hypothetical protein [Victivallis sp. Marseille-Q1083]
MKENIVIKTRQRSFTIPAGRPVLIRWECKNKSRPGVSVGIGWLKKGDRPHTVELVHQTFSTWDQAENEYASHWTIYESRIIDIRPLQRI